MAEDKRYDLKVTGRAARPRSKRLRDAGMSVQPGSTVVVGGVEGLEGKLDKYIFDDLFEKVEIREGVYAIRAKYGLFTNEFLSAKGIDEGDEGGTGGASYLGQLVNVGEWADQTPAYDRIMVQLAGSTHWTEKRLDEIGGGLDEEQLAAYLTENNYAKTGDIPSLDGYATEAWVTGRGYITSAALNGYATQSWVVGKGYATTSDLDSRIDALVNGAPAAFDTLKEIADVLQGNVDSIGDILTTLGTKADKSISISAGTGLTGGGTLSANRTLSLKPATTSALGGIIVGDRLSIDSSGRLTATYTYTHPSATATTIAGATGKVLSAITVNSLGHVTSVAAKTLAAADIPSLAISKITGLQAELDKKLDKSVLDDLFEKVEIREGVYAIHAKYGLFTNEFLSAKGMDEGSESPGGGATKLSELTDVSLTNLKNNDLLRWNGTWWVNVPQSSISPSLAWENITGKPSTFPPLAHTHTKSQITDFPATWAWGAISGKPTTVKGYGITDAVTINDDQTINSSKKWATDTSDLFIGYNENGTASVKHIIHTTAGWARGYAFVNEENGIYCSFGAYGQGTTLVYQYVGNNYLSPWQKWNGTRSDLSVPLYINNYKVWHSGNVGSGSGLNADLLDGVHREGLFTNLGSSTVTKLSLTIGNTTKSLTSLYASHADTVRATACNSTTNSKLWNEFRVTTKNGTLNVYDVYNDGGPTTYGNIIEVVSNVSNHWQPQLWFAGSANGSLYHRNKDYNSNAWSEWAILLDSRNYSDYVKKIGTETVGSGTRGIYLQAGVPTAMSGNAGSGTRPVYLNAGVITQCGTSLAVSVTGNAATATTLQTARTIWGQSFDGTANVSGALTGVTNITASGSITAQKMYITGTANSNAYITADTSYNMYFVANGLSLLSLDGSQKAVRSGSGYASQISLGTATVRWSNLYSVAGNFSGDITANRIKITDTDAVRHIEFSRTSYNYLTAPAGTDSSINFIVNGQDLLIANADLSVRNGLVCAGTTNATSLGNSTYRWSGLYSVLGNFSGAVTMASTLAVTGALTAKGGVNFNGSQLTNVSRIEFQPGDAGRKTVITNGGSFLLYGSTGGWAAGLGYYGSDGTTSLGNAAGAYGSGNTLNYYYYGGTYSSPKMVLLPGGNFGIGTTAPSQKLHVAGNILATGSITAKAVSDIRLKTIVKEEVDYRKKLLGLGSVVDFYYNDKAIQRNTGAVDRERHTGLVYQSAKEIGLPNFCHTDDDGYGAINYLCTDYINLIAGALQQTIVAQETIEQRVERLERENKELKCKLNNLSAA